MNLYERNQKQRSFFNWKINEYDASHQEFMNTKVDNSLVVLMHDSNEKVQTVESLSDIIVQLKNEGYTFKTFYEIF